MSRRFRLPWLAGIVLLHVALDIFLAIRFYENFLPLVTLSEVRFHVWSTRLVGAVMEVRDGEGPRGDIPPIDQSA